MRDARMKAFLKGWASVFDLSGGLIISIPDYRNGPQRDRIALRGDWETVGRDIRRGMTICSSSANT